MSGDHGPEEFWKARLEKPESETAPAGGAPESQADDCNVICPYCLYQYQAEAADYTEREIVEECEKCGAAFLRCDDFTVTHHTRPLPNEKATI